MILSWLPVVLLAIAVMLGLRGMLSRLVVEPQRRPDPLGERLRACAVVREAVPDAAIESFTMAQAAGDEFTLQSVGAPALHTSLSPDARLSCWHVSRPSAAARSRGTAIMLHGFSDGSHRLAKAAIVAIRNDWRAMLVDLPGHGLSPGSHATFGRDEVPLLVGLLRAMKSDPARFPEPFVLVGYSYGASMSIATMLHLAERDAGSSVDGDNYPVIAGAVLAAPYWDLRATMHRHAARYMGLSAPRLINDAIALGEQRLGLEVDTMGPRAWLRQSSSRRAPLPRAVVLRGENDSLLLDDEAQQLTAAWHAASAHDPGCRLVTLPELAHDGVWEAECTLTSLPEWLDWIAPRTTDAGHEAVG